MKILHVTSQAPDVNSGGAIGIFQSMYSLINQDAIVDYVGPKITNKNIRDEYASKYNKLYELSPTRNIFKTLMIILRGKINRSYYAWKSLRLDFEQYDAVFLDFTRQDYVFKDVMKKNKRCKKIVRLHNVEYDYARKDFATKKSIENAIVYMFTKKQERNVLKNADSILALTNHDSERIQELYRVSKDKISIMPVCVKEPDRIGQSMDGNGHIFEKTVKLLITGSLWFGPNVDGILWFIEKVVTKLDVPYALTVAGFRPNEKIKEICHKNNVTLIDSPPDMTPVFEQCDVVIAPVFDGAGMKVKIAEALSYKKTVMSTEHGLIGYIFNDGEDVCKCNTPDEYVESIRRYAELSAEQKLEMSNKAYELYCNNYSLQSGIEYVRNVLRM